MKQWLNTVMKQFYRPVLLARVFFILLVTWVGALWGWNDPNNDARFTSSVAFIGAIVIVLVEYSTNVVASRKIILAAFGGLCGLIFATLFYPTIPVTIIDRETARISCNSLFTYFGVVLALRHADWLRPGNLKFFLVNPTQRPKILDSSVIIDGRITDVIALNLVSGPFIIPDFVLREIQAIADSGDVLRRARGRRGLDVLDQLRTTCKSLDFIDTDYSDDIAVDQRLILLSRSMNADLITNDYNLHKIAQLQQIAVLNLNEIADALRPPVFVGEMLLLQIVKPGKESGQGVGYLKDGSMVVVEDAEQLIGQECRVVVSNILQNPSGRLTFAKLYSSEDAVTPRVTGTHH